jgi:hypothetical protein
VVKDGRVRKVVLALTNYHEWCNFALQQHNYLFGVLCCFELVGSWLFGCSVVLDEDSFMEHWMGTYPVIALVILIHTFRYKSMILSCHG